MPIYFGAMERYSTDYARFSHISDSDDEPAASTAPRTRASTPRALSEKERGALRARLVELHDQRGASREPPLHGLTRLENEPEFKRLSLECGVNLTTTFGELWKELDMEARTATMERILRPEANRQHAAVKSNLDCAICLEPLSKEKDEALACGHRLHSACLERNRTTHREAFRLGVLAGTSGGMSGARCPLCNAWTGMPPAAAEEQSWFEWTPLRLVRSAMGFIYQSRWQAEGEDRSMAAELDFIAEHIRLARDMPDGIADTVLQELGVVMASMSSKAKSSSPSGLGFRCELSEFQNLTLKVTHALTVFLVPDVQTVLDGKPSLNQGYLPYVGRFLRTIGLTWDTAQTEVVCPPR